MVLHGVKSLGDEMYFTSTRPGRPYKGRRKSCVFSSSNGSRGLSRTEG